MTLKEKTGYILILLILIVAFIFAVKFSLSCFKQVSELLKEGEKVEAEVIRVEEKGDKIYKPIFRFRLSDGSIKEHGNDLAYGDLFSKGDKIEYIFHPEKPKYSRPKTFVRLYGVFASAVFIFLFCLSFIVVISLKILSIPYVNNKFYGSIITITFLIASIILGVWTSFEIKRTSNLLDGGIQTIAEVVRVDGSRTSNKKAKFPVFSFIDSNGMSRDFRQNWSGSRDLKIGDSVAIIYNPKYTTVARRNSFWYIHGLSILMLSLSLIFCASSVYYLRRFFRS